MILALICASSMIGPGAADFFPLVEGTVRKYEQKASTIVTTVSVVGKPLDMGGVTVTPVRETPTGSSGTTTYYRVDDDQVAVVAYDIKHPFMNPMPVLKLGAGKVEWDYQGVTKTSVTGERLVAHGEAHAAGKREVLGKMVDVIEVKLIATIGMGMTRYVCDQDAIYARGIGLVDMVSKVRLGDTKQSTTTSTHLVSIEQDKGAN